MAVPGFRICKMYFPKTFMLWQTPRKAEFCVVSQWPMTTSDLSLLIAAEVCTGPQCILFIIKMLNSRPTTTEVTPKCIKCQSCSPSQVTECKQKTKAMVW